MMNKEKDGEKYREVNRGGERQGRENMRVGKQKRKKIQKESRKQM